MQLSIRKQIAGRVAARSWAPQSLNTAGPGVIAAFTLDAIDELKLTEGRAAAALIKSAEVAIATGPIGAVSIRHRFDGSRPSTTVCVMATVNGATAGGVSLTAVIIKDGTETSPSVMRSPP
jgi:molybdate transport system regulatory protein